MNNNVGSDDAAVINNEAVQRWAAEKERREQLEKRNIELMQQLRSMKSSSQMSNK